ncbi:hypothetical protein QQP08_007156 [Theobroma cacao]|nr:hypothetical protein QQP08_007156 [Theobroma cacao]
MGSVDESRCNRNRSVAVADLQLRLERLCRHSHELESQTDFLGLSLTPLTDPHNIQFASTNRQDKQDKFYRFYELPIL